MALDYQLHLQTDLEASNVLNLDPLATRDDVWMSVGNTGEVKVELIKEVYDIDVSVELRFRLDTLQRDTGLLATLGVVNAVLVEHRGDAVLLFNGETAFLLRKRNHIYLDDQHGFWSASDRRATLHVPYTFTSLPAI